VGRFASWLVSPCCSNLALLAPAVHNIEMQEASEEFARCWQAAGRHIQMQLQGPIKTWLKVDLSPPIFWSTCRSVLAVGMIESDFGRSAVLVGPRSRAGRSPSRPRLSVIAHYLYPRSDAGFYRLNLCFTARSGYWRLRDVLQKRLAEAIAV
jgi:hypothetical protein